MTHKLSFKESENLNLVMNLLKETKYWERLSKLPQVRCGHLNTLISEREQVELNGCQLKNSNDRRVRLIELTKNDSDFQTLLHCYNILWEFDYKLGEDLLGNYDV